jgi:ABC-type enterochelin transport system substrate-binding protein
MASPEAIKMMEDLKCLDAVSLLGMDEKDVKSETLEKALKDDKVKTAGDLEKPEYQKVVKDKTDLAILPGTVLPDEIKKDAKDKDKLTEEAKDMQKNLEKLESRFTTLDVPVIVDRSAQEKDELAQAEWIKVYGALYGCEEQADKIFDELVKKADKK